MEAGDFLEFPGNLPHQVRRLGRHQTAVLDHHFQELITVSSDCGIIAHDSTGRRLRVGAMDCNL